jgi:hypothetical protein
MTSARLQQILNGDVTLLQLQPDSGAACWFYIRLRPGKRMALEVAMKKGQIDCAEFGDILASGYGDTPPAHVRWAMEQA